MTHRAGAVVLFVIVFLLYFFDNLYKLNDLEWVPQALGAVLMVAAVYLWNPNRFHGEARGPDQPPDSDGSQEAAND